MVVWYGGPNSEQYTSGSGNDSLYGREGNDILYAGSGNDYLNGGSGNDLLYGEEGNDSLYGREGNDILNGGSGNDTLVGTAVNTSTGERDILEGGGGADIFVLGDSSKVYYDNDGYDGFVEITDFDFTSDSIRVHGSASDYSLVPDPINGGIDINYQGDIIGWVSNTTNVDISRDFNFV